MLAIRSRRVFLLLFAAFVLFACLLVIPKDGEQEQLRNVVEVRHSAMNDAPRADDTDTRTMDASYYGRSLEGSPTASGEPFDPEKYTAAHKSLPLGTKLKVSRGGESVEVTVNDRGPYVGGRDIDLSLAAAQQIGLTGSGSAPVQVIIL